MNPGPHQWIYPWREPVRSPLPKLLAIVLAGALFAAVFASVRVPIIEPAQLAERKATVIFFPSNAEGQAWALRAKESGPFPARFDPRDWDGLAALEGQAIAAAAHPSLPPYVPALRELSELQANLPAALPSKVTPVFPKRLPAPRENPPAPSASPLPRLYPVSGISMAEMPRELPEFQGLKAPGEAAVPGEIFLLRLAPGGSVTECVALSGTAVEAAASPLESWLLRVKFPLAGQTTDRWASVAVSFSNTPADGPDAR